MNPPKLSPRLMAAAGFVRSGAVVADVGTDHAYLPIYLCKTGRIRCAVASDINEGPVERAKINIASHSLEKKISVCHTDGLSGIESYSPTDIIICGMGGELIAEIISKAEWTKNRDIRLILQPMTHAEKLRDFLNREGYSIIGERIVKEDKLYQIICAEYSGKSEEYSELELMFGKYLPKKRTAEFIEYAEYVKKVYTVKKEGKGSAGADVTEETRIIADIEKLLAE